MPAGDLLVGPGDIEWAGLLISSSVVDSGYWYTSESSLSGWDLTWVAEDLPTAVGGAAGLPVPQAMYPTLMGAVCESAAQVASLFTSMVPTLTATPLTWWDYWTDTKFSAPAVPRRRRRSNERNAQFTVGRMVDLQWFIGVPDDITTL